MWITTIVIRLEDHFCDNLEILSRSVEERMVQNTLSIERLDRERVSRSLYAARTYKICQFKSFAHTLDTLSKRLMKPKYWESLKRGRCTAVGHSTAQRLLLIT